MPCCKYDLQGLHARVYLAREADGRACEDRPVPVARRQSGAICTAAVTVGSSAAEYGGYSMAATITTSYVARAAAGM